MTDNNKFYKLYIRTRNDEVRVRKDLDTAKKDITRLEADKVVMQQRIDELEKQIPPQPGTPT